MSTDWFAVIDGTWPAARYIPQGPVLLREGQGGGQRVAAASAAGPLSGAELSAAESAMRGLGQAPLFQLRPGQDEFDAQLAARGYQIRDPVSLHACPAVQLTDRPLPRVTVFYVWEPLAIMTEIWAQAGIGAGRRAVMDRVAGPKTGLLLRHRDQPAGAAFVAIHDGVAMIHALEILPEHQRRGLGGWAMRGAAFWALENGAHTLSVLCTKANDAANGLYRSLGMEIVGAYHYRRLA